MASYSDNFNRANGALGANWTETKRFGAISALISGNQARLTDTGGATLYDDEVWNTALDTADHHSSLDSLYDSSGDGHGAVGCVIRKPDAGTTVTFYLGRAKWASSTTITWTIYKFVNGTATQLATGTDSGTFNGSSLKLSAIGTSVTLTLSGVDHTITDSAITTGLYAGFELGQTASGTPYTYCDNWAGADNTTTTPPPTTAAPTTQSPTTAPPPEEYDETGRAVIAGAAEGETDAQACAETGRTVIVGASLGETDAAICCEVGRSLIIAVHSGETDAALWLELVGLPGGSQGGVIVATKIGELDWMREVLQTLALQAEWKMPAPLSAEWRDRAALQAEWCDTVSLEAEL